MLTPRAILAEFVGTFGLVFVGGGAIIVTGGENLVAIAAAHGLILATMITATMHISGGQLNPAVSVGLAVIGRQPWPRAGAFIAAQLAGAVVAAYLLRQLFSAGYDVGNLGATLGELSLSDSEHRSVRGTFGLEMIGTFFLMFAVMGTAVDHRGVGKLAAVGGFGIGLTLAADILCIGPATGGSVNPARSFGPALVAGAWDMHWVYWVAPIVGATLAAVVYQGVFGRESA